MLSPLFKRTPLAAATLLTLLTAAGTASAKNAAFDATVYRTSGGIPHIIADDWGSIGYGTGFAAAEDHFCKQSKNALKFRGELAANFGPGEQNANISSDFFYKLLAAEGIYDEKVDKEFDRLFAGYAAGFNRYLRDTGIDNIKDPACGGAAWVQPLTADDVRRFHLTPAFLPNFSPLLLAAKPPAAKAAATPGTTAATINTTVAMTDRDLSAYAASFYNPSDKGSNGVAIGKDASKDGASSLLFANPHLEWKNFDFRMYAMHQIIPGVSNMLGANQAQRAHVGFGTNGDVAWTNTVSTSQAYMFYKLDLVPGNPMAYSFDGKEQAIEAVTVSANVLAGEGRLIEQQHTFYKANNGYMVGGKFPWMEGFGVSLRIANEGARGFQGGAMAMAQASTVNELKQAINTYQSTPGINTIAVDNQGQAMYGDLGPIVNYTDQQLKDCVFKPPMFQGNSSKCAWNTDDDSAVPGLMGASKQAAIIRNDYATNSNDSYWLANPNVPFNGIPAVQGNSKSERTLRTRSGLTMVQQRIDGNDGLVGKGFDLDNLVERMLSNQHYAGQILRDDVVTLCRKNPAVSVDGNKVDLTQACQVLSQWSLTADIDSRGSHLFREFLRAANGGEFTRWLPKQFNYTVAFDLNDPVNTPRGLDTNNNPEVLQALAKAVLVLQEVNIPADAVLGDIQYITRNGEKIPMPAGEEFEGVFNKMAYDPISKQGYPDVTGSSASWVMATQLTADNVKVKGVVSYSQSSDPTSPHYSDLSKLFSAGEMVDIPFTVAEVKAAALSTTVLKEGVDQCLSGGYKDFVAPSFRNKNRCIRYFKDIDNKQFAGFSAK
ncbi:Aculeacin-A acylase [Sinobacterium norvegicum]|uniref:Aculeacin-A acylase n=1 Tax=Sinobacterium norvegicum TaxID=1641715 RepID=A0ABM9AE08_9GAMM|nr:penicillin acylase family protein [Sinobacterium norvegicum]CAH0991286.1 Aculeacin-A acylase [Sinobacterium norvegicum]